MQTEVRSEAYNPLHHFSPFGVTTTLGDANLGQITSATYPPTSQFGLRIKFETSGRVSSVAREGDGLDNFVPYKPMPFLVVVTKPPERE